MPQITGPKIKLDSSAVQERIEELRDTLAAFPESVQELFWEDLKRRLADARSAQSHVIDENTVQLVWESHHVDLALAEARLCLG